MSIKPKFTPGPWSLEYDNSLVMQHHIVGSAPSPDSASPEEQRANAALIAAAPELYQIAEAYRNLLQTIAQTDGQIATFHHIESVLAKARGES